MSDEDDEDDDEDEDEDDLGFSDDRSEEEEDELRSALPRSSHASESVLVADHGDGGGVVDLLDNGSVLKHVKVKSAGKQAAEAVGAGYADIEVAADGRFVIPDVAIASKKKEVKRKRSNEVEELAAAAAAAAAAAGPGARERKKVKVKKVAGSEFKSKKGAGGDVQRGQLEPYAFIPLDGRVLGNKKNHGGAMEQYGGVVEAGNAKGAKGRAANVTKKGRGKRR